MGVDFRDQRYMRQVRVGKRTIKDGEAAVIWNMNGVSRMVVGPRRERLFFSRVRFLQRFTAHEDEFLIVNHRNGDIEHIRGPAVLYENPVEHENVQIAKAIQLQSGADQLIVYREVEATEDDLKEYELEPDTERFVKRRLVKGPTMYFPEVGEWVHKFAWSDADEKLDVTPAADRFTVLSTGIRRITLPLPLRTRDNVVCTVHLQLAYKVDDVWSLLDNCADPVAELCAALQADMVTFGSELESESLHSALNGQLSDLDTFMNARQAAENIGIHIQSVLYQGFLASYELQQSYNQISARQAQLKADLAAEEQKQQLTELEFTTRKQRTMAEQELEEAQLQHEIMMKKARAEAELLGANAEHEQTVEFLTKLREMDVDLTKFLCTPQGLNVLPEDVLRLTRLYDQYNDE